MQKRFLIILGIIFVLLLGSLHSYYRNRMTFTQTSQRQLEADLDNLKYLLEESFRLQSHSLVLTSSDVNDWELLSESGKQVELASLNDSPKLIYLFENETCWDCVYKDLEYLGEIAEDIGEENILLIGESVRPGFLFHSKEFEVWKGQVYRTDKPLFPKGYKLPGQPLFLIINSGGSVELAQYSSVNSTAVNEMLSTFLQTYGLNIFQ